MLMTKTSVFDRFLTSKKFKKLSIYGGRKTQNAETTWSTADWLLTQLKKTRTRGTDRGLSKSTSVFERGSRKVSSLTTRIGQVHFLGRKPVPNEYAKEARGLSMLISTDLLST